VTVCAHCGRRNDDGSRFCMDCGKPMSASAMAAATPVGASLGVPSTRVYAAAPEGAGDMQCTSCGHAIDSTMPFCAFCGAKLGEAAKVTPVSTQAPPCPKCGTPIASLDFKFCPNCATALKPGAAGDAAVTPHEATAVFSAQRAQAKPPASLVLLDDAGTRGAKHPLVGEETTVGRAGADINFGDDPYLSPIHALFMWKEGKLSMRDLGSRNGTWIFLDGPHRLVDGDLILVGSQLLRFRRLGYPGPHPPEADATRRMGSLVPSADIASLAQLRADGSVRDVLHLSPGRDVAIGRDRGDWPFPYDPSMSGAHAIVRSEDADFVVQDAGSRNGVAVASRGDIVLKKGSKILVGDKLMMIEMA
jgi:pSer/pThr/pTyr-binding forkhead associated (FHA) protein